MKKLKHRDVTVSPNAERELRKFIRVQLPCGASATVSKDISAKGLAALDQMMRTAMKNVTCKKTV